MKPSYLKRVLAEIVLKTNVTPLIWGSRGTGKSQIVASLTRYLTEKTGNPWGLVDLRISTQEISDLTGIPRAFTWQAIDKDSGRKALITETDWSVPVWFPTVEKIQQKDRNIPENGIVFLDEINRGGQQETQAIFQFVLDKKIHTHKLAPGWKIVAAANPPTDEYLVSEFDAALLDRFIQLVLKPDVEDWLIWAGTAEVNISEKIKNFISVHPEMLYEFSYAENNWKPAVTCSPRSWESLNTILFSCQLPAEVEAEVYSGLVGGITAVSLVEYLRNEYERPVTALQIMNNYLSVRDKIIDINENNRIDQLHIIIEDVIEFVQSKPLELNMDNFYKFFMDLRNDLKVTLIYALMKNNEVYTILNSHDGLIAEITGLMEVVNNERVGS